jgi:antitoxin PrlF
MAQNPARIRPAPKSLVTRARALVEGVEVDLEAARPDVDV